MKAIIQSLSILLLIMCLHACAVNGFSRQKYTNFNHSGNLRMKGIKRADPGNALSNEAEKPGAATLLPRNSIAPLGIDSIPEVKSSDFTNEEINTVIPKKATHQSKQLSLNSTEKKYDRFASKIKKSRDEKRASRNSGSDWTIAGIFALLAVAIPFFYKIRIRNRSVKEEKLSINENPERLNKQSRLFSWLAYFFLLLFAASVVMVFLLWEFILVPILVLGAAVVFLTLAFLKGKKHKKNCTETGTEYTRKAKNRHIFNCVLLCLFGALVVFGSAFILLLYIML